MRFKKFLELFVDPQPTAPYVSPAGSNQAAPKNGDVAAMIQKIFDDGQKQAAKEAATKRRLNQSGGTGIAPAQKPVARQGFIRRAAKLVGF